MDYIDLGLIECHGKALELMYYLRLKNWLTEYECLPTEYIPWNEVELVVSKGLVRDIGAR